MIDFSNIPLASDHNLYYYIKNKDYSVTNGSSAFIKYDTAFFDLVTFSSLDSVASLNGVTYIPFDTSKWSAGSLDSEGYAVGIGSSGAVTTSSSNDNEGNSSTNTSLADLKKFLSNASGVFALLTGGFAFIGQVFANFTSIMPTELMIVLNAILITTGVVIVVNIVKKFV